MLRCQIVLQGRTGIPEDQFVNTLYFDHSPRAFDGDDMAGELATAVGAAYNTAAPGGPEEMGRFLSRFINPSLSTVRIYNMAEGIPRTPYVAAFGLVPQSASPDLPEEVALCASFHGSPPITPRRRGRVYLGPLNSLALAPDSADGGVAASRPTTRAMQCVRSWMELLHESTSTFGFEWVIQSNRPTTNYVPVTGGYCDDSWDTQRRRGVDPTTRWSWPSTV